MVDAGKSVVLDHVIISGEQLDLSGKTINGEFRITHSIIRPRLGLARAVFSYGLDLSDTCLLSAVHAEASRRSGAYLSGASPLPRSRR
jgi:hypothetical protein